jgi:hypothetical protein
MVCFHWICNKCVLQVQIENWICHLETKGSNVVQENYHVFPLHIMGMLMLHVSQQKTMLSFCFAQLQTLHNKITSINAWNFNHISYGIWSRSTRSIYFKMVELILCIFGNSHSAHVPVPILKAVWVFWMSSWTKFTFGFRSNSHHNIL